MTRHAIVIVISIALLTGACSQQTADEVESDAVVPVTVEPASTGSIRASVAATGLITPAPNAEQIVIAPQPGRIAEMPKAEGDLVREGDLLVRFEIPAYATDLATRRAEVTRAAARLENARAAQTRARDLFDRGVAARKEMEDADRELADAHAGVAEAQATLAAAENAAGQATVRARFNGLVAKRLHNPGDLVDATASDAVMRIVDPRRLEVTAAVPIPDVSRIVVGAAARMTSAAGDISLHVVSRPAAVEPGTATAPVRLAFEAPSPAPVGTPVQLSIDAEARQNVLLVPTAAIVHEGEAVAVFVAAGDKAERRPVQVGLSTGQQTEIRSGLAPGEPVIVQGQAGLPDDAHIRVAGAAAQ
jgi:cobalt-zinc-cadmium efflux system membrane fusion protein